MRGNIHAKSVIIAAAAAVAPSINIVFMIEPVSAAYFIAGRFGCRRRRRRTVVRPMSFGSARID
jgi:hypothetical protein